MNLDLNLCFQADGILNRIHVAEPKPRDSVQRPAFIPEAALKKRSKKMEVDEEEDENEDMEVVGETK